MKTVFFLNCTDVGSTGKIIADIAAVVQEKGYRCVLCAPNITKENTPGLHKYKVSNRLFRAIAYRISKFSGNRYGLGSFTARSVIRRIRAEKADLVHIHCPNGSFMNLYQLFRWLKKNKIPTVVTNHAEFFYTGNCDHAYNCDRWMTGCGHCPQRFSKIDTTKKWWKKMQHSFAGFSNLVITSVSPWILSRSQKSPILENADQRLVLNGVNTDIFHIRKTENIWDRYGIQLNGKRVVLYVTACFYGDSPQKGSEHLLRLAEKMADENVVFIVAGSYVADVKVPANVVLLGRISDQHELAKLYSAANVTLITSQRETFSMPVAESLCCGTPVVGFYAGGPESISLQAYSQFVEYGDTDALSNALKEKWLQFKTAELALQISANAMQKYDKIHMADNYVSIYEEITGEKT